MVFANKTYGVATPADRFAQVIKKRPVLFFGLPFLLTIVGGSFVLSELTATKYNVHDHRTKNMSKEEGLKLSKNRRKLDLQEEYWRLQSRDIDDNWEIKRVSSEAAPGVTTSPKMTAPPSEPSSPSSPSSGSN
ncbi:Cytochrome oxidase assembly [Lobosporangium transversale]|uniref:Cytochrome c oxidase assembly protein COX16, mitochondrial n=1 Tax=Lobosporangium transversale TaxID=64571 RepID=A0A1Y2H2N8_9FUNG|nr:cytochrome c oxidase assembly protein COX16-domain-containing protein [Lobosporangium transversale]KAF9913519.1 Cytochrome oxidase assembly [Lobosporangium transversale]ORZ28284.1 cytochrome c oxidase assembly protein COX16-domain-containing protein [Lobosporangium transversale]|eukprot:XP_021885969.1 cytochrome c oxidase assembly protein COX16-domain-containing protein [Lobosporangium transversale]